MANKRITDVDFLSSLNGDESFFVNQNNAIKQINKANINFGINNGGTGANNIEDARRNLEVYSKEETYSKAEVYSKEETYSKAEAYSKEETYSKAETDAAISSLNAVTMASGTVTIPVSKWVQNSEYDNLYYADMSNLTPNINESSIIFVSPVNSPIRNFDTYVANNIRACEQGHNTINFIANTKPDIDIVVNYTAFELAL